MRWFDSGMFDFVTFFLTMSPILGFLTRKNQTTIKVGRTSQTISTTPNEINSLSRMSSCMLACSDAVYLISPWYEEKVQRLGNEWIITCTSFFPWSKMGGKGEQKNKTATQEQANKNTALGLGKEYNRWAGILLHSSTESYLIWDINPTKSKRWHIMRHSNSDKVVNNTWQIQKDNQNTQNYALSSWCSLGS